MAAWSTITRSCAPDWSGDNVGDLLVGVKVNLMSEWRQQPAAIAVRGIVKLPTGEHDVGRRHGQARFDAGFHHQQGIQ